MPTPLEAALWMVEQFNNTGLLLQKDAAQKIQSDFGDKFVYVGENGNLQIAESVLKHFEIMTKETAVWAKDSRYWRARRPTDPVGVRRVSE